MTVFNQENTIEFKQTAQNIAFQLTPQVINFSMSNAHTLVTGLVLSDGDDGDILRWNENEEKWETKSEPFEFKGLILTPAIAALIDAEGALYYNSTQKAVMVCTDI
jgi:hypothetical protein